MQKAPGGGAARSPRILEDCGAMGLPKTGGEEN